MADDKKACPESEEELAREAGPPPKPRSPRDHAVDEWWRKLFEELR